MINKLKITVAFIGLTLSQIALAQSDSFASEVSIKAGKQQAQLKTNIGIFEQNIEIIHGNRKINADRLEVHRRAELGENKQLLVATGSPALFSEKQADGTLLSASAQEVRYDVANKIVSAHRISKIRRSIRIFNGWSKFQRIRSKPLLSREYKYLH